MKYIVISVDVDPPVYTIPYSVVEEGILLLLKLFDKHKIKATFFLPAIVAEKYPSVSRRIVTNMHEVACHGLKHNTAETTSNVSEQVQTIKKATEIIQSVTGVRPVGFRAPLFRINRNCWIALQRNGYLYDSSLVCSPFFGCNSLFFPTKPFLLPSFVNNSDSCLLEIPVSTSILPFPLGGAWMRIFGLSFSKIGVKINFALDRPVVIYTHPKDVVKRGYGRKWWYYSNSANCVKIIDEIINYAKNKRAKILTALELAKIFTPKLKAT